MLAKTGRTLLFQILTVLRHEKRNKILNHPIWPYFNAQCILWCLRSLSIEIRKTQLHLPRSKIQLSTAEYPILASMVQSQLSILPPWSNPNWLFSKSSNSQDHLFRVWCHPHSSPIFSLGVYYDNGDCHIFPRERKTAPKWLCTWALNPNSSKPDQTEW